MLILVYVHKNNTQEYIQLQNMPFYDAVAHLCIN